MQWIFYSLLEMKGAEQSQLQFLKLADGNGSSEAKQGGHGIGFRKRKGLGAQEEEEEGTEEQNVKSNL